MDLFQRFSNLFSPLYFSHVPGTPHKFQYYLWKVHAPIFYGENPLEFITEFLEFIVWKNVIYEEEIMKIFSWSMRKQAKKWYLNLPPKSISSFYQFLIIFKESEVKDEDIDLVRNFVDSML